jgi:hypothetical protein
LVQAGTAVHWIQVGNAADWVQTDTAVGLAQVHIGVGWIEVGTADTAEGCTVQSWDESATQ